MRQKRATSVLGLFALTMALGAPARAQDVRDVDWPLHNLDLYGGRYSPMDQINRDNVATLTPRWLFQHGVIDGVSNQTTPVIVDGVMYVTDSRGSVYAVNAADGHLMWTYDVTELLAGGRREGYIFRHRGVTYERGVVYSAAGSFIFALDAKTGEPIESFGENGQASVILDVLRLRYPDVETAISMGYWFTSAPQIHDGVIYVGSTRSESLIPGGHVLAVDAQTGEVIWHFNTIPQDEKDQGWDIAGPTWVGGGREGGGIWETPAIDPELGMLYVAVGNPFGDSTKRAGLNLFTDSILALSLESGQLEWYYQQVHHDVWDYDNGQQPILFDMEVDGAPVKALAQANKNAWLYILNRETGEPVHPIIETAVSTETDRARASRRAIGRASSRTRHSRSRTRRTGSGWSRWLRSFPKTLRPSISKGDVSFRSSRRSRRTSSSRPAWGVAPATRRSHTARRPACSTSPRSTCPTTRDAAPEATSRPTTRRPASSCGDRSSRVTGSPGRS